MITVYKYVVPVPRFDACAIDLPRYAEPIHVAAQGDEIMLWARVDTEQPTEEHRFCVVGTGHRMSPAGISGRYLGTAHLNGGALVFHVFEEVPHA